MQNQTKIIYHEILKAKEAHKKLLAILLDPDKIEVKSIPALVQKIQLSPATHIFVGGSIVTNFILEELLTELRNSIDLPIVLFPGDPTQISDKADAILFLSLLSGRNSDYLIEYQVQAAPILKKTNLEIISTGYILIESGSETAVARVSKTTPLQRENLDLVLATAQAGEMLGTKLIYLEAGSGAKQAIPLQMISLIAKNVSIPVIVGGGIVTLRQIQEAHQAGADLVVIGTAFENDNGFFETIKPTK
ncbi:geranylgeranylglyceryl/heptaprenylglyceryl phosphate synthase [Flavobacterium sp. TAB 87]|uniref:geranylgeranylglyceryl/heptaprenylglyceryl phosphate synthase n=1 Tax=Flavobacterium sp. TAB 87 TaxID=1729581 RepID=UPI00076D4FE3|nr:geranylgeranylglyceryl/heptaprenylglyceryl phosphate synthase [Flavobacterium sp. TAB 87]KVV14559.1 geranylgeranylglyceryl phosphate synthase-like protein [Flavobacterium sp. TAB 87]